MGSLPDCAGCAGTATDLGYGVVPHLFLCRVRGVFGKAKTKAPVLAARGKDLQKQAAAAHVQKERIAICMAAFVFGVGEGLNLPVGQLAHGPLVGKIFGYPAPEAGLPTKQVSTQRLSLFFSGRKKARNPWRIAGFRFLSAFAGYGFGGERGIRTLGGE